MTNEEILKKAMDKAWKNGWNTAWYWSKNQEVDIETIRRWFRTSPNNVGEMHIIYDIIFRHEFAKSLGYKLKDLGKWCDNGKEPLKYLAKFL